MLKFGNIDALYYGLIGVPIVIILFVLYMLWKKKALNRFGDWNVMKHLFDSYSRGKIVLKLVIWLIAYLMIVLAISRPQQGSKLVTVERNGVNIMIALDVSNSMNAEDIKPNRLQSSKMAISRLVDGLVNDRIGMIVFAGRAYVQLPITTDFSAAKLFLESIGTNMIDNQGTAISEAIRLGTESLKTSKGTKVLIIITDGEDHEGNAVEEAEKAYKDEGIITYTIGIGTLEGTPIPDYKNGKQIGFKKDRDGNTVITRLDEATLQKIATAGHGKYVRANNTSIGLGKIMEDIDGLEKSKIDSKEYADYEELYQYFLAVALLMLVLEIFVSNKKSNLIKRLDI